MADRKHAKKEVDYSPGHEDSRCGICQFYIKGGECELVRGEIDPGYWCKLFKKAKAKS